MDEKIRLALVSRNRQWISALNDMIDEIASNTDKLLALTPFTCQNPNGVPSRGGCGKTFPVNELAGIQTHWYVTPSGCSDGDYWMPDELHAICPYCSTRHRLIETHKDIVEYKQFFKSLTTEHER